MSALTISAGTLSESWITLAVEGEIDLATVTSLEEAIGEIYAGGRKNLVVDLTNSSFMDSTGLRALIVEQRRFEDAGRSFAVAVAPGPISRLIDLSGVDSSIRVVDSPGAVIES